jgi:hypothetical protein
MGIQWQEHEADHSPPCSTEVKNAQCCTSSPSIHLHAMMLNGIMYTAYEVWL